MFSRPKSQTLFLAMTNEVFVPSESLGTSIIEVLNYLRDTEMNANWIGHQVQARAGASVQCTTISYAPVAEISAGYVRYANIESSPVSCTSCISTAY